ASLPAGLCRRAAPEGEGGQERPPRPPLRVRDLWGVREVLRPAPGGGGEGQAPQAAPRGAGVAGGGGARPRGGGRGDATDRAALRQIAAELRHLAFGLGLLAAEARDGWRAVPGAVLAETLLRASGVHADLARLVGRLQESGEPGG